MKRAVLIVDDEPTILHLLEKEFSEHAYTVYTAKNGKEGLKQCKKQRPDAVVLDLMMPKMRGLTMLHELRQLDDWGRRVPVVILTNLTTDDEALLEINRTQPAFYLNKSDVKMSEVVEKVDEALTN